MTPLSDYGRVLHRPPGGATIRSASRVRNASRNRGCAVVPPRVRIRPDMNTRKDRPCACFSPASVAGPAVAQENAQYHVTKFEDLAQSMEALLNGGYTIVNESVAAN